MVGMVVTISPSLSLYKMVVLPAASRPTIRILISFFPHNLSKILEKARPMIATQAVSLLDNGRNGSEMWVMGNEVFLIAA